MSDARRRRRAKQARRDARRSRQDLTQSPEDASLVDEVRQALASGHPLDLLGLVGMLIEATSPNPIAFLGPEQPDATRLDELVDSFISVRMPETTVLLAVLAELLVDADDLRDRCRIAVSARSDRLPEWLSGLAQVDVYRAVRMTHVLGDGDEILIGARLVDGNQLTCAAFIDHNLESEVKDAFFIPDSIDAVLSVAKNHNTDSDTSFIDLGLADAGAWVQHGLERAALPYLAAESETWPACRPLLLWLVRQLPGGGVKYEGPQRDSDQTAALLDTFFSSTPGQSFDDFDYRTMLLELCLDTGTGDPLRWSAARVEQVLGGTPYGADEIPVECLFDVPVLLGTFIPFAHAESGIRAELTAEALAVIEEMRPDYQRRVLAEAERFEDDTEDG